MEPFRLMCVVHVFLIRNGEILLLRRRNTGHHDGDYGLPSGKLEAGEELHSAAIREAREECGAEIAAADLKRLGVMHIKTPLNERVDFFFSAEHWTGDIMNHEPDKCDDISWFPVDGLPANTVPFVGQAWKAYNSGQWFMECGYQTE